MHRTDAVGAGRRARTGVFAALCALAFFITVSPLQGKAQDGVSDPVPERPTIQASNLLGAWLVYPELDAVDWRYVYLRLNSTAGAVQARRGDLFKELEQLLWRLDAAGYERHAQTVRQWQARLESNATYRQPGDWSPAWLMVHPTKSPPVERVEALGSCVAPGWVELWTAKGIERIDWQSGMRLSDVVGGNRPISRRGITSVAVVSPEGSVERHGVVSWNETDTALSPGSRIVAPLPLDGQAFPWIRDTIAELLAHMPAADSCREIAIAHAEPPNE